VVDLFPDCCAGCSIAGAAAGIAKLLFGVFLVLFLISLDGEWFKTS
jgi:uncharacterized membrane protein YtjA (UPF0391 family)